MGNPFGALSLSSGKYATAAHHARLQFDTDSFTVNVWFKGTASGPLINKFDNATSKGWAIEILASGFCRVTVNATTITSAASLLDDAWHAIEFSFDRSRDKLLLFIDGAAVTPVAFTPAALTNTATLQLGRNPAASATLTGNVSEVRISHGVRNVVAFTPTEWQFDDDGYTRLLWHFNEGKGATLFDMSADATDLFDSGVRQDGTLQGGTGTWVYGPLLVDPGTIINESAWYALDTATDFNTFANAKKVRRHRGRETDESTSRILTAGITIPDMPGVWLDVESVAGIPVETNAYKEASIPLMMTGALRGGGRATIRRLWWTVFRAIHAREITDAGGFFHHRVQNWHIRGIGFFRHTDSTGQLISRFVAEMQFAMRLDIRTSGAP